MHSDNENTKTIATTKMENELLTNPEDINTGKIFCLECSKTNNVDANFCQYCGTKLTNLEHIESQQIIDEPNSISFKVLSKAFNLNHRFIIDLTIAILIISDTFLLFMLDFSNVNPVTVQYINNFDLFVCFVLFCDFTYRLRSA